MPTPRPVPQHIDRSTRAIECLVLFMLCAFIVRPIAPALGLVLAVVLPLAYLKLTVGKPDGYLMHLTYRLGVPVPGLLSPRIKRFRR